MQIGYDPETKTYDVDRFSSNFSSAQRSKIYVLRDTLKKLESRLGKLIPLEDLKKDIGDKMSEIELGDAIKKLEKEGMIFTPKRGFIQRI